MRSFRIASLLAGILVVASGCTRPSQDSAAPSSTTPADVDVATAPDPAIPQGANNEVPVGWETRFDRDDSSVTIGNNPDSADVYFVNMTPGWHLTTGPAGIFYHPASMAQGEYTANMEVYLFDPGERLEGYGLIVGGRDLDTDEQNYVYFLIRNDQKFIVKQREGAEAYVLQGWTESPAITQYDRETQQNALNRISVDVQSDRVALRINDTEVYSMESPPNLDGIVGIRANHGLNLHISDFGIN